jgi:predicted nucleic acid-binding protein
MAADPVFLDTNVLIYLVRPRSPFHATAVEKLRALDQAARTTWISPQILREYLAVATRQQGPIAAVAMQEALRDIERFRTTFEVTQESPAEFRRLLELLAKVPASGKQVHDANLVATMLENGFRHLLTFNQRDFRRFTNIIELEPI